jgi:hypothetical protein
MAADGAAPEDKAARVAGALARSEQFELPGVVERCCDSLTRDPADAFDWRLRLLARGAQSHLTGDPLDALREIEAACAVGDPWIEGGALELRLQIALRHTSWRVKLPFEVTWPVVQDTGERATAAYERSGDAEGALRVRVTLTVHSCGTRAREQLVERITSIGAEARDRGDVVVMARCLTAAAITQLQTWAAGGEIGRPPVGVANAALEASKIAGTPLYTAELFQEIGKTQPPYLLEAMRLFRKCGHFRGWNETAFDFAQSCEAAGRHEAAAEAFQSAIEAADGMRIPSSQALARQRLAQTLSSSRCRGV